MNERKSVLGRPFRKWLLIFLENYVDLVDNLIGSYHKIGSRTSLKLHLHEFPVSSSDFSDEHGELFIKISLCQIFEIITNLLKNVFYLFKKH